MQNDFAMRSDRLKRRTLAWALAGISATLLIAALGAAADPFSSSADPAGWVSWHWIAAVGGFAVISGSFYAQYGAVSENHDVIQEVLADAKRIREERGAGV